MLNPHELRALEIDAELARLHATHLEGRSKIAALESQRALLQAHSQSPARKGLGFWGVLAVALAAALVGAILMDVPEHPATRAASAPPVAVPAPKVMQ